MTTTSAALEAISEPVRDSLIAHVRAQSSSIAAEAVSSVHGPVRGSQPRTRTKMQHTVQAAYCAIDRVLRIVEGKSHPLARHPEPPVQDPEALTASRIATAQTWQLLLRGATPLERERLLHQADLIFKPEPSCEGANRDAFTRSSAAERLADALIRQDDVREFAAEINMLVADAYLVIIFGGGRTAHKLRDHVAQQLAVKNDALVGHKAGQPVVLLPLTAALSRSRVRELADQVVLSLFAGDAASVTIAVAQAEGPVHVARATDEALSILQVVDLLDHPAGIYQLDDVPVEVSLLRSPDLANLLALRLAPLSGSGAPLLDTLKAYLDTVQDRRRTARILNIHVNTLDYRLRRIRQMTGLSPTAPRDIQTLGAALAAWKIVDMLGGPGAPGPS